MSVYVPHGAPGASCPQGGTAAARAARSRFSYQSIGKPRLDGSLRSWVLCCDPLAIALTAAASRQPLCRRQGSRRKGIIVVRPIHVGKPPQQAPWGRPLFVLDSAGATRGHRPRELQVGLRAGTSDRDCSGRHPNARRHRKIEFLLPTRISIFITRLPTTFCAAAASKSANATLWVRRSRCEPRRHGVGRDTAAGGTGVGLSSVVRLEGQYAEECRQKERKV
jgi:hypothetical protein